MGVCLVLYSLSEADAERVRADPPLVWLLLEGEAERYLEAKRTPVGWLDRLRRRPAPPEPEVPEVAQLAEWCDIDKSWHALHFLLVGSARDTRDAASFLVERGDRLCDVDVGYSPPEYRSPSEVAEFARALAAVEPAEIEARVDAAALKQQRIYPMPSHWSDDPETREYLGAHFEALKGFVAGAARRGHGILLQYT